MSTCTESKEGTEEFSDSESWNAFSINMAELPPETSKVLYFPQGHIENFGNLDLSNCPSLPAYMTCRVSEKKFIRDPKTDELFQTLTLMPLSGKEPDFDSDIVLDVKNPDVKRLIFCKTLSQSDVDNSEEFSVSKHCAETLFPRLDVQRSQTIEVLDVQKEYWKFTHVFRGAGKGHLLTEGWSQFMNAKKLVAGNSIMMFKAKKEIICVWIKRSEKVCGSRQVKSEDVIEAMNRAARGEAFDVIHCTGDSAPASVVLESLVKPALEITWCPGMRVKSASSYIRSFTGTIVSVDDADPVRWPDSPWMRLQVRWDEPEPGLLQNVTRVNPWLVELLLPTSDLHPFPPPPFKKAIDGPVRYLVGPSSLFTLACIQAARQMRNPSEGSSSGVNQPDADEQSLGEGSSEQPPGEGSSEQSPGEGSSEQSLGEGSSEQSTGEGSSEQSTGEGSSDK